jgi:hypothetical protein
MEKAYDDMDCDLSDDMEYACPNEAECYWLQENTKRELFLSQRRCEEDRVTEDERVWIMNHIWKTEQNAISMVVQLIQKFASDCYWPMFRTNEQGALRYAIDDFGRGEKRTHRFISSQLAEYLIKYDEKAKHAEQQRAECFVTAQMAKCVIKGDPKDDDVSSAMDLVSLEKLFIENMKALDKYYRVKDVDAFKACEQSCISILDELCQSPCIVLGERQQMMDAFGESMCCGTTSLQNLLERQRAAQDGYINMMRLWNDPRSHLPSLLYVRLWNLKHKWCFDTMVRNAKIHHGQ